MVSAGNTNADQPDSFCPFHGCAEFLYKEFEGVRSSTHSCPVAAWCSYREVNLVSLDTPGPQNEAGTVRFGAERFTMIHILIVSGIGFHACYM